MAKAALIARIGSLVQRWQAATQRFDDAVGRRFALSHAEMHCLGFLVEGPKTASAIARETGLSPAAITALVDRLEARRLVRRRPDPDDRRRVLVALGAAAAPILAHYRPVAEEGGRMLAAMSEADLSAVVGFMERALALQTRLAEELEAKDTKPSRTSRPRKPRP